MAPILDNLWYDLILAKQFMCLAEVVSLEDTSSPVNVPACFV